jgi:SNF2 family DNA or RNA helicase
MAADNEFEFTDEFNTDVLKDIGVPLDENQLEVLSYGRFACPHGRFACPYGRFACPYGRFACPYGRFACPYGRLDTNMRFLQCAMCKGVVWMLRQEIIEKRPGGILAYDMGTGKTRMCMALMKAHQVNLTLIVTTNACLNEWEYQLSIYDFDPEPLVIKKGTTRVEAQKHNIFLVSYDSLRAYAMRLNNNEVGPAEARWFMPEWGRVILDEGHAICNRRSMTFKVMSQLKVKELRA